MKRAAVIASVIVVLLVLCLPSAARSATEPTDSSYMQHLDEVVVTAIKNGASVGDKATPTLSVGIKTLEEKDIVAGKEISAMVPNLYMPGYGSRMTSTIYVRGIGARIDQPAMGLTIDNIPILCKENYDVDLFDMENAAVLRGPQSTFYGRNTMGGLMQINTLSPADYQGTRILAEYGSHNAFKLGAGFYHAIVAEKPVAFSFNAYATGTDGEFTNLYNGKKTDRERLYGARSKFVWQDREHRLTVANTLMASHSRQSGYPYRYVETGEISYNDTCFYRRTSILDGLTVSKAFDRFTLTSVTSYQYLDDNMTLDQDFTPLPYFTLTQARREHAVTQEVIAKSETQERYNWIGGIFAFYRRYRMDAPVTFKDIGIEQLIEQHRNDAISSYPIEWDSREFLLGSRFTCPTYGLAAYHRSTLNVGDFTIAAGLRLDYEHARLNYTSTTHTGYSIIEAATGNVYAHENIDIDDGDRLNRDFIQLLPRLAVTYHINERNDLYVSAAKGYKAGGFNTQMFSDVLQQRLMRLMGIGAAYNANDIVGYKPEKAWNFELGANFATDDNVFSGSANVFYIDCRDRQLTVFPDGTTTGRIMTNAGKTRNWGAEAQLLWKPLTATSVTVNYGYTNAKFVEYHDGKADYKDKYVPYSPTHTLYASAGHVFDLNANSDFARQLSVGIDCYGAGKIFWNEANTLSQPFYALLGAGVTLHGKRYALQLWGRNLTDTRYSTFYFVSIGHEFLQRGHGRSLGITLRVNIDR